METLRMGRRAWLENRENGQFEIVLGRLRPGASLEQARVELDGIAQRLAETYPGTNRDRRFNLFSLRAKRALVALMVGGVALGLVSLVLLVACANVAGLLLAQAEERRKKIAVRVSLGASRWRLIRQFLTESALLALAGAAVGLLLGSWLLRLPLKPAMLASFDYGVRMNAGVFAYAFGLSLITAVVFGLLPALKASKFDLVTALKSERGKAPRRLRWLSARNVLVASQIAIAQFLLAGTVLWVKSYVNVSTAPMGFDPNRKVLFVHLAASGASAAPLAPAGFQNLMERLRTIPGVLEVSGASHIPLSGSGGGAAQKVVLPGQSEQVAVRNNVVAPRYFAVMGSRLLRGRDFELRDTAATARTVIVNQTLARRLAPAGDAVGRWLRVEGTDREIIGVVENGKYVHLREPEQPYLYLPARAPGILAIGVAAHSPALAEAVRKTVAKATPQLRVIDFGTLGQNMKFATYVDGLAVGLFGVLGLLGMSLAAVGLYGVIAHAVNRRTQEIGVRLAVGAPPASILKMILGQGLRLALVGVPLGLAAAVAGGVAARSLLFGVKPLDAISCLAGSLVVVGIALLASHFPARRATRIDPAVALRAE
jgi:predicted permease